MGVYTYERVLARIREMMEGGELQQGQRLPPERHLAERFGVSRHAVRQALQSLGERGLVIRRQGSGTLLMADSAEILAREMACLLTGTGSRMDALLEFRLLLEPQIAAVAAGRISQEQLERVEELIRMQEEGSGDFRELDARFHGLLAEATGNVIIREVMTSLAVLFDEGRSPGWLHPAREAHSLAGHRVILATLKKGDREGARQAMEAHIQTIRESLVGKEDPYEKP
ncbi:FCD domain-containing protein [Desulfobotulus sp. H1]|uniref:FCD domain-containing protein n=1 Tax=Desulfobotulus pelophilus TaxID=2823377 RepID=A0ABT3N5C0_9BACT|nr:FCD domain-containing protein [Desulfobotulus pelophilus]MCW7752665.1 FCD domain-containing protein [Desulfobotulus pelophilus]